MTAQETTKEKLKHIKEMINNRIVVNSLEELRALNGENLNVYLYMDKADLSTEDLSNISYLKLKEGSTVTFSYNDFLQTNVDDYVINFGKHKGEKLIDVFNTDRSYCMWLKENSYQKEIKDMISQVEAKVAEQEDEI